MLMEFYFSHKLRYSLSGCSTHAKITSEQFYSIQGYLYDQEVNEKDPFTPKEADADENHNGTNLMVPSNGSADDGKYQKFKKVPKQSSNFTIYEVNYRPHHEI